MVKKIKDLSKHSKQDKVLFALKMYLTGDLLTKKEIQEILEQNVMINYEILSEDLIEHSRCCPLTETFKKHRLKREIRKDVEYCNKIRLIRLRYIKEIFDLMIESKDDVDLVIGGLTETKK